MRTPGPIDLRRERALVGMWVADLFVQALFITSAILTGSLTMLGEVLRLTLVSVLDLTTILFIRALHRDRLSRYRVAIGKIEIVLQFVIGCALLLSAFWVGSRAIAAVGGETASIPPALVAIAAVTNATNVTVNALTFYALRSADGPDASPIYRIQVTVRLYALVISAVLQTTLTLAALTRDAWLGTVLNAAGAGFTTAIMLWRGVKMTREAFPDLLDHPLDAAARERVRAALSECGELGAGVSLVRTRRGGNLPEIELSLAPLSDETTAALCRRVADLEDHLVDRLGPARLTVAFAAPMPVAAGPEREPPS